MALASPTAFASKAEYLAFVQAWKLTYKHLSLHLRLARLESRHHDGNRPGKGAWLAQAIARTQADLAALGETPAYLAAGVGRYGYAFGSAEATWLLQLRAAAKEVARRQMEAARAAKRSA